MADVLTAAASERTAHPLEPLSAEELQAAVDILRRQADLAERVLFEQVTLQEPPKALVTDHCAGADVPRGLRCRA